MSIKYTDEENKVLNKELKSLQAKAKRLIFNDYYDSIQLSELQYSILKQITNAKSHNDINAYLWNTGMLHKTLDTIKSQLKQVKNGW